MSLKRFAKVSGVLAASVALTVGTVSLSHADKPKEQNYILATASTGGTYYPVGVALSTLVKVKLHPKKKINLTAINSAGSGANVKLLRENGAQFAIIQGLFGAYAWSGTGPVKKAGPQKEMRSVTMLWPNVEHFVVKKEYVKTGTIDDIKGLLGKPAAMGKKNSGTIGSNRTILANLGIDLDKSFAGKLVYAGYGPSSAALQDGKVEMISTPAGSPVSAVTRAYAKLGDKIQVLDFTDEQMKKANGKFGSLWTRYVIAPNTYPGQAKAINTIAQPNFLAVRSDLPEETVYLLTKTIYENLGFLNAIHKATKAMSTKSAIAGLPVPLHPGAAKYYKEIGIKIPDNLMAK